MNLAKPIVRVVEDDRSVRTALQRLLQRAGFETRCYGSAGEFLLGERDDVPGCVVLDVRLPGLSGMELHAGLAKERAAPPVIFLTGRGDLAMSVRAMKAGAVDFLSKPVQRDALLGAIETALTRDAQNRLAREQLRQLRTRFEKLTARERTVFASVAQGKTNKSVALELGVSLRTIKAYRSKVMQKLEVRTLPELVRAADELARVQGT
jgi:FixJ family two-component response regulator